MCARLLASALVTLAACGGAPAPAPVPPPAPRPVALAQLVPADAHVVWILRPRALLAAPATRIVVDAVLPDERIEAFRVRTGVDFRALDELLVIDHPEGRVIVARGALDAPFAVQEIGERMAPIESTRDEPLPRRVGFLGTRRHDVAAIASDTLVVVDGTPSLAGEVLARTREGGAMSEEARELWRATNDVPAALIAPRWLGLPPGSGIGLLFARQRVLSVRLRAGQEWLELEADVRGAFPPGALENFRALARSVAESDLGAVLGAADALPTLELEVDEARRVVARATVDPRALATGLRAVLSAELRELVGSGPEDGVLPRHPEPLSEDAPRP
ncbi:MAG: hypothetical protein IT378_05790 [Sandaracinaceae bacterium]|nr:hypothetical protein [Sandaracinaceae bacterium]